MLSLFIQTVRQKNARTLISSKEGMIVEYVLFVGVKVMCTLKMTKIDFMTICSRVRNAQMSFEIRDVSRRFIRFDVDR